MVKTIISFSALGFAAMVVIWVYCGSIAKNLKVASIAVDKPAIVSSAQGWVAKIDARLVHLKTIVLAGILTVENIGAKVFASADASWQSLPWAQVFDEKIAAMVTIACGILIPIAHSQGLAKAAITPPNVPNPPDATA